MVVGFLELRVKQEIKKAGPKDLEPALCLAIFRIAKLASTTCLWGPSRICFDLGTPDAWEDCNHWSQSL